MDTVYTAPASVPVAVHAWLSHPADFRAALLDAIRCGGDTDTVGAIVGGIVGSGTGVDGIPAGWIRGLLEWQMTARWIENLGEILTDAVSSNQPGRPPGLPVWGLYPRNLFFMILVLAHGLRRLAPPY